MTNGILSSQEGQFAIAVLVDGIANLTVLHEPGQAIRTDAPPLEAQTVCGVTGYVYLRSGFPTASKPCQSCANPVPVAPPEKPPPRRYNKWDHDAILGAVDRWQTEHGRQPLQTDWLLKGEWWPSASTCRDYFGSWAAMLEAAGLEAGKAGRKATVWPHGTEKRYFQGCRKPCCREAHRVAARTRYRAERPWLRNAA